MATKNTTLIKINFRFPRMKPQIPLNTIIDFWENKKSEGERGGTFNVKLYFDFCTIKKNNM